MNPWLLSAGVLASATLVVHLVLGRRDVVPALLSSVADEELRYTAYLCWHVVSIVVLALAVCFLAPALGRASPDVAWLGVGIAGSIAVWNLAMVALHRLSPLTYPQWTVFASMAGLAVAGLVR